MKCNDEEKVQICAKQQTLRRDFTNYRHVFQTTRNTKTKRNWTQRRAEMNDSPHDVYQCINHREKRSNTNAHGLKLQRKLNESKSPWWRKLICGKEGVTVREFMFRAVTDAERRRIVRRCLWTATANRPSCLFSNDWSERRLQECFLRVVKKHIWNRNKVTSALLKGVPLIKLSCRLV